MAATRYRACRHPLPKVPRWTRLVQTLVLLVTLALVEADYDYIEDYSYGDPSYSYDDYAAERADLVDGQEARAPHQGPPLPLCCPPGHVYDYVRCRAPPQEGGQWGPHLDAAPSASYVYSSGFPRCTNTKRADLYQAEVFVTNTTLYVPHYLQLHPVLVHDYCVVRVVDPQDPDPGACSRHSTKVYACIDGDRAMMGGAWALVGLSHLLLLIAVAAFVALTQLRVLQGQYVLCLLITLLLYNVLQFPASALDFPSSVVSCVALRAIKYFFFCGVFLWFNVVCFDVWRTLKNGHDMAGRRRFVLYSAYTWLVGALLTTPIMVLTISSGAASTAATPVPGHDLPLCSVGLGVHVVLQLVQGVSMIANAIMLGLAASQLCRYSKLGCGLPRSDASMCLKQATKLFVVMVFHALFSVSPDILDIRVIELWQYTVLESVAFFSILVYRRSVILQVRQSCCRRWGSCCRGGCPPAADGGSSPYALGAYDSPLSASTASGAQLQGIAPEKVRLSSV